MTRPDLRARAEEAGQLLRLRRLRHEQALAQQAQARAEQAQAREAVRAAQAHHAAQQQARQDLLAAMRQARADLPRLLAYAEAERERLDDQVERAEYAVIDEEEVLQRCDHRLDQAGAALRRARGREQAAEDLLRRQRQALLQQHEQRAEREDPGAARPAAPGLAR